MNGLLATGWLAAAMLATGADDQAGTALDFDYFRNSWNVIGLKDYVHGTRVTPDNELQLSDGRLAQIRLGPSAAPLSRRQTKRLQDGWLPIILLDAADGAVRYEIKLWATPLPTVKDWRKAFDWPTEGENFLNWITVRATNSGGEPAEGRCAVAVGKPPTATAASFRWQLPAGQSAEGVVRIPFSPVADEQPLAAADAGLWLERTADFWRGLLAGAARIDVPCRKATEALLAAHVCQLIANDHGQLHGGEGFYDEFYIRDGAYQLMELEEAGLGDAARKAVEFHLRSQRPDGRFETQANQYDANGQAVWALWQYYRITGDRAWLERVYPPMVRAVEWTRKARRQAPADSPFAGLLPAAPADGEFLWDGKHHIVGYDVWNLRGALCTADAAATLGRADEARHWQAEADEYRAAIAAAGKQAGVAHFPPSWEKAGTHWGNTETLWPTALFAADDPRVSATIDHARRVHGGGFVEGTIQWLGGSPAIHPYLSAYTTMASLRRHEHEAVVQDFHWYLLHSTAAHAFPEGVFPARRFAWSHTIPHVTGASNYAILLRHMLVDEQGDELHLLPAVPDGWLDEGRTITVQRLPTHFGELGLTVHGTAAGVKVEFRPPAGWASDPTSATTKVSAPTGAAPHAASRTPRRVVLHVPRSRPLQTPVAGVEVLTRAPQAKRWDFPAVVRQYQQTAGAAARPIPGLIAQPLATRPDPNRCHPLKLEASANTDPFTAPFGVPRPGRFLFTGMPVGEQTIEGIPFQLIDPQKNGGRGLIVLHSPRAPANIAWPQEVRIPVDTRGKRLFLLGNVHGWAVDDPGTGPWEAVAEYEIKYADGQSQTVPLITGRTIDDWASPATADDVRPALRGDPWHLNLLAVELRDATVQAIIFRDLGTPAAPLLAAATIEQ